MLLFYILSFFTLISTINATGHEDDPGRDLRLSIADKARLGTDVALLPILPAHSPYLYPLYTNPVSMRYFGFGRPRTHEEIDVMTAYLAPINVNEERSCTWLIVTKAGAAGLVGLHFRQKDKSQELWYGIATNYSGKGIVTKAAELALEFSGKRIFATAHPANGASIAVLHKLGFVADSTRQNVPKFNSVRNYYTLKK